MFEDRLNDLLKPLMEAAIDRVPMVAQILTGKKSRWEYKDKLTPEQLQEFIMSLVQWDPTGDAGRYLTFIAKAIAGGSQNIVLNPENNEDGQRIRHALEFFNNGKNTPGWQGPRDINQWASWRELERLATEYEASGENLESKRARIARAKAGQGEGDDAKGYKIVFQIVIPTAKEYEQKLPPTGPKYTIVKITTVEGSMTLGQGTSYCTRYKENAVSYLRRGPLYQIYRSKSDDNSDPVKPENVVLQFTTDTEGFQACNRSDLQIVETSPALDYTLGYYAKRAGAPLGAIAKMRALAPDYPGKPA